MGKSIGVDPAILDMARQMLLEGSWELDELATMDAQELKTKWQNLSQMLASAELPFSHENGGYRYLTFGGMLVNDVICRWKKLEGCEIDDLCIWSPCPIDFRGVPKLPEGLANQAAESLKKTDEMTVFQSMLPADLLRQEMVEPWCRISCFRQILRRLASSEPKRVESGKFRALLA